MVLLRLGGLVMVQDGAAALRLPDDFLATWIVGPRLAKSGKRIWFDLDLGDLTSAQIIHHLDII